MSKLFSFMTYGLLFSFFLTNLSANSLEELKDAELTFDQAWHNPRYTPIELEEVDINQVLHDHYETARPLHFTRAVLWDMEVKKAWDPLSYIPYVVSEGKSWQRQRLANGHEVFVRSSKQRQWVAPEQYGQVFEKVYLNHDKQQVTFIGTNTLIDPLGKPIKAQNSQPLFHVQHAVGGSEQKPTNIWRIVHLTQGKDERLIEQTKKLVKPDHLPGFLEIYIQKDLQTALKHKSEK